MPIIEVVKSDLERLVGLRFEEITRLLEHVKCEVEEDAGDSVKLEVTHDRPDHFSAEGLARTLKGVAEVEVGLPPIEITTSSVELKADHIEERPYISMAVVRGVRLDEDAIKQVIQLQEKLHETYGRGRRRFAIGFYDVSRIRPPIYYRRVSQDDEYTPLGFDRPVKIADMYKVTEQGQKYSSLIDRERPPALVDSSGQIMVVIPVLGSECCKITTKTRDILIDVTGTDLRSVNNVMSILIYALLERSSEKKVEVVKGGNPYVHSYTRIGVDPARVGELLGVDLDLQRLKRLAEKARLGYENGEVVVPPYRINVLSWVDVAEDIALMIGYNALPRETAKVLTGGRRHAVEVVTQQIRIALLSMGFAEVNNYVLTDSTAYDLCTPAAVANPISELYEVVRCSIVPQLIATAATLKRREIKIFEVGEVVRGGKTLRSVASVISRDGATLTDGLSVVKALCKRLGLRCQMAHTSLNWALPNRAAAVEGDVSGYIAEVHPDILAKHNHLVPTVAFELFLKV